MVAALLQKLQTLSYPKIRFGLEAFSCLASMGFEPPALQIQWIEQKNDSLKP